MSQVRCQKMMDTIVIATGMPFLLAFLDQHIDQVVNKRELVGLSLANWCVPATTKHNETQLYGYDQPCWAPLNSSRMSKPAGFSKTVCCGHCPP